MRRENYKRLGEYIFPYLEKNVGLKVTLSQGINNNKYFQTPRQVAVDSENDQIVRTGQFAYNKATTRNGEKISIAYWEGPDCTVSSAYQVFYIKDEEKLNPHYLLMWFKRPDFDRYARFKSFGSAHEFFTWEEMCNVYLPIPSIEEQRKIVAEYQAVEQRIENNNRLIKALEDTAQAIYHHTFVENNDPENLPEGWKWGTLADIAECYDSKREPIAEYDRIKIKGIYPYYGASSIMDYVNDYIFDGTYLLMGEDGSVRTKENYPVLQYVTGKIWVNNHAHVLSGINGYTTELLYVLLARTNISRYVTGGVQEKINQKNMFSIPVILLPLKELELLNSQIGPLMKKINVIKREIVIFEKLNQLLLSKLS